MAIHITGDDTADARRQSELVAAADRAGGDMDFVEAVSEDMEQSSAADIAAWDSAAERYAATVGRGDDSFSRRFEPLLARWTPERGSRVLDLGCGHGWLAGALVAKGLIVDAVDASNALIDRARRNHPEVNFGVRDLACGLGGDWRGPYKLVVSHMVLMDLPRIDRLLADVASRLDEDGVVAATILHPSFFHQQPVYEGERHRRVTGYLDHEEWWIETFGGHRHYHRPLSWYVQQLRRAGLAVIDLEEPPTLPHEPVPESEWTDDQRWFAKIPTMLFFAAKRL